MIPSETMACDLDQGIVGRGRPALLADLFGELGDVPHQRVAV